MSDSTATEGIRSETESAAQTAWGRLRAIIESLADGIVIVDRSGVIRFANPAAARLFTRTPEALVGTTLGTPLIVGGTTEMEIVRRGGGELVYAELRVVATEWEGETVELVSLRDVTDRKYAEERSRQLTHEREARLEAEAASRAKSDFLAIMSHELRTPLNAILGYSELIDLGISGELSDKMRHHLLGLVNNILDLAKVEAGRLSVANVPGVAIEAIASAITLVLPQAETRNLTLDVSPDLVKIPPYLGDADRVRQILVNLLSNAVKCTEPGGTITIDGVLTTPTDPRARLQPRRAHIRLSVTDTGSGILPEKLNAIFEPFVQAESGHTRAIEGSGLGLTIGRRLARAMGGDLTVESSVGVGSTFSLWLPAVGGAEMAAEGAPVETTEFDPPARAPSDPPGVARDLRGLCEVSEGLMADLGPLVRVVVGRIRSDPALPMAAGLRTSQVADHLATMLADMAGALLVLEEAAGEPSLLLADAMEIQRLVAERHGAQRARLGWTESALRREMMIVREELERVVRAHVPPSGPLQGADAVAMANRFLDQVEYLAVRSLEKAREE
jgi:signal transduction histidine kinase